MIYPNIITLSRTFTESLTEYKGFVFHITELNWEGKKMTIFDESSYATLAYWIKKENPTSIFHFNSSPKPTRGAPVKPSNPMEGWITNSSVKLGQRAH